MTTYAHRNGETEPPTIEGSFWFKGKLHHHDYSHDVAGLETISRHWRTTKLFVDGEECAHYLEEAEGQWWGPVVPPWSAQPAAQE